MISGETPREADKGREHKKANGIDREVVWIITGFRVQQVKKLCGK